MEPTEGLPAAPREEPRPETYVLRLFVAGTGYRSVRAIANAKALCETHLKDRYDLEIVDIYQQPMLAAEADIVAVPVLVKLSPPPSRKFIGDLSDIRGILSDLGGPHRADERTR